MELSRKPRNKPHIYGHRMFNKEAKTIQWKYESALEWCWTNWMSPCRGIKIDPYLSCTKLKSKYIKKLNMKPDALNLMEEKVGNTLDCRQNKSAEKENHIPSFKSV